MSIMLSIFHLNTIFNWTKSLDEYFQMHYHVKENGEPGENISSMIRICKMW